MKKIKSNIVLLLLVSALTSCNQTEFDAISMEKLMGDSLQTTTTFKQVISKFTTDKDRYSDLKLSSKTTTYLNSGLFTTNRIDSTLDLVVSGVVTSSDVEGNIYKYMTIQELSSNGIAFKVSIDASGLSAIYPLGQRVWIKLNGLYLGKYAQSFQIGTNFYNSTKMVMDTVKKVAVYRNEPGRISLPIAMKAIHAYGLPDPTLIVADTMTIAQIKAGGSNVINKLVCIKNAYFTGKGADYNLPKALTNDADYIFAPSTNGVGYPQSREIQDGTGSIFVSTSEFSKFAKTRLPSSGYIGNITAIVGWYNDKKPYVNPTSVTPEIYHQLTIRGLFDLGKGFEGYHTEIGN